MEIKNFFKLLKKQWHNYNLFLTIELSTGYLNLAGIKIITKNELINKSGIYGFLYK